MNLRAVADEVFRLWSAGWPYVHVETLEEERALRIASMARELGAATWLFTPGKGPSELHEAFETEEEGPAGPSIPEAMKDVRDPADAVRILADSRRPALLVLRDMGPRLLDHGLARGLRELTSRLARNRQCVLMIEPPFDVPALLAEDIACVLLPPPDPEEICAILDSMAEPPRNEGMVAAAVGLTEKAARRAFAAALQAEDPISLVLAEKRRQVRDAFAIEIIESNIGYGDVGGLDSLKRWLDERERAFGPEAREFGLPVPRGVLLLGVQGCGKSISAKAVASHWRLPLMRLDLAAVFGGGMPAERALRRAISLAEQLAPAVLWIDEIEKGFAGADPGAEHSVAEVSRLLGAFTTWLQEKTAPVFVVATANEVKGLPPELLRRGRFDEIFFVDLPDATARMEILAVHLRQRGRDPVAFPLAELSNATEHFSGAELEQVVTAGLYRAFRAGRELSSADLDRAAADTVPLFRTYEERVKELRAWSRSRARPAGRAEGVIDLLRGS